MPFLRGFKMNMKVAYKFYTESHNRPAMRAVHRHSCRSINASLDDTLIEGVDTLGRVVRISYRTIMSINTPLGQPKTLVEVMEPAEPA